MSTIVDSNMTQYMRSSNRTSKGISFLDDRNVIRTMMETVQSVIINHDLDPDDFTSKIGLTQTSNGRFKFSGEKLKKYLVKLNLELKKKNYGEEYMFHKNFIIMEVLGKGAFGEVTKVYDDLKKVFYAKKTIRKSSEFELLVLGEIIPIIHLTKLGDPDLLQIVKIDFEPDRFLDIYMEYGLGTLKDLGNFMEKNQVSYKNFISDVNHDLLVQINKLSEAGLCHRDIKPDNIIITNNKTFKLADFGCCEKITKRREQEMSIKGTIDFMLPVMKAAYEAKKSKCLIDPFEADTYAVQASCEAISKKTSEIKNLKSKEEVIEIFDSDMKFRIYKNTSDSKKRMEILAYLFKNNLFEEIIAKIKRELEETNLDLEHRINMVQKLGEVHYLEKNMGEAINCYMNAIKLIKRGDIKRSQLGQLYLILANIYAELKEYPSSIDYLEQAIKENSGRTKESALEKAEYHDFLGIVYAKTGKFKDALEQNKLGLDLRQAHLDEGSPEVARSYSNLGLIYLYKGAPGEAMEHMNRGYGLRQRIFTDENNSDIADSYQKFGEYYCKSSHISKMRASLIKSFQETGRPKMTVELDGWSDIRKSYEFREKYLKIKEAIVYRKTLINDYEEMDFLRCFICQDKIDQNLKPKMKQIQLSWLSIEDSIHYWENYLLLAICTPYIGEMEIRESELSIDHQTFEKICKYKLDASKAQNPLGNAAWFRMLNMLYMFIENYSEKTVDYGITELEIIYQNGHLFLHKDELLSSCRQRIFEMIIKTKNQETKLKSAQKFIDFLTDHHIDGDFEHYQICAFLYFQVQVTEISVGYCKKLLDTVIPKFEREPQYLPFFYFMLCFGYHGLQSKTYVNRDDEFIKKILEYGRAYMELARKHYNWGNILNFFVIMILLNYSINDTKECMKLITEFHNYKFFAYEEWIEFNIIFKSMINLKNTGEFTSKLMNSIPKNTPKSDIFLIQGICELLEYSDLTQLAQNFQNSNTSYFDFCLNFYLESNTNDTPTLEKLIEIYEYNGIKLIYQERFDEAFDNFFDAYVIKKELYKDITKENADYYITSYSYLATAIRYKGGTYKLELDYRQKILEITITKYEEFHLKTAEAYENLAIFYHRNKKYAEAIDNFLKSYHLKVRKLGYFHIDVYKSYKYLQESYTYENQKIHSKVELEKWVSLSENYHSFFEGIKLKKSFEQKNYPFDDEINIKILNNLRRYNYELYMNDKYKSKNIRIIEKIQNTHTLEGIEAEFNLNSRRARRNDPFYKIFSHIQFVLTKNLDTFEDSLKNFIQEIIENPDKVSDLNDVLNFFALYSDDIVCHEKYYKDTKSKVTQEIKHPIFGIILFAIGLGYRKNGKFVESKSYLQMSKSAFLENEQVFRHDIERINTILSSIEIRINPRHAIEDNILEKQEEYDEYDILLSEQHMVHGMYLTLTGKYEEAIEFHKTALNTLYDNNSIEFELKKGYVYDFIGINYCLMQSYNQAVNYHNQGLVAKKKALNNDIHINLAISYDFLRINYTKLGEKNQADENAKKAAEIRLKFLTERRFDITLYYGSSEFMTERINISDIFLQKLLLETETKLKMKTLVLPCLGELHLKLKNTEKAFDYFDKILIQSHEMYKIDPNHFTVYENIATYALNVSNFKKAYDCLITALDMKKSVFGEKSLEVAVTQRRLGIVTHHLRKFDESLNFHKHNLQIISIIYDGNALNEQKMIVYDFLGMNHYCLGNLERAFSYHKEAMELRIAQFGAESMEVANSYEYVGRMAFQRKEYSESITFFTKALEIYRRSYNEGSPHLLFMFKHLIQAKFETGSIQDAYDLTLTCLNMESKYYDEFSLESYDTNLFYIQALLQLGEFDRAIDRAEKALHRYETYIDPFEIEVLIIEICAKKGQLGISCKKAKELVKRCQNLKPFDIQVAQAHAVLGKCFLALELYKDAIASFERALNFKPRSFVEQINQEADCFKNLIFAYKKDGEKAKAEEYSKRAELVNTNQHRVIHDYVSIAFENISLYEIEVRSHAQYMSKKLEPDLEQTFTAISKLFNLHGDHKKEKFYILKILQYEIPTETPAVYFKFLERLHFDDQINLGQFKKYLHNLESLRKNSKNEELHLNIDEIVQNNYCFLSDCTNLDHKHIKNHSSDPLDALDYKIHDANDYFMKELSDHLYTKEKSFSIFSLDCGGSIDLSNSGLSRLGQILEFYRSLSEVRLNFSRCFNIRNEGLIVVAKQLNDQPKMKDFYLNISYCNKLSEFGFKNISYSIGTMIGLEKLHIDYSNLRTFSDETITELSSAIQNLKSLSCLILNFSRCLNITDESLRTLGESMQSSIRLKEVDLNFSDCVNISDKGILNLAKYFQKLKIEDLSLEFKSCYSISDETWIELANTFGFNCNFQRLSMNFADCTKISDSFMKTLSDSLMSQVNLEYIKLDFSDCTALTDDGLKHLSRVFYRTRHLQTLDLNFTNCIGILQVGIEMLAKEIEDLKELKSIHFDFSYDYFMFREELNMLFKSLTGFEVIEDLHLVFKRVGEISDSEIEMLAEVLLKNPGLKKLHLDFMECLEITDLSFIKLFEALKGLNALETLYLDFGKIKRFTDSSVLEFAGSLNCEKLKHLYLGFRECTFITKDAYETLLYSLSKLTALTTLDINMKYGYHVDNDIMKIIGSGLTNYKELQGFKINLGNAKKLKEEALDEIAASFETMNNIRDLEIDLKNCKKISQQSINKLMKSMLSFQHIKTLNLNFRNTKVHFASMEELQNGFLKTRSLHNLSFDFGSCSDFSDEDLLIISKSMKPLNKLQTFSITLDCCRSFTDIGLKYLCSGLRNCSALNSLTMNLRDCSQKLDNGIVHLAGMIDNLLNLKDFHFRYNCWIGKLQWGEAPGEEDNKHEELKFLKFFGTLKHLDTLNSLTLEFKTHKVTRKEMKELASSLANLPNLQELAVTYHGIKNYSTENFMELAKALKNLKRLQSLKIKIKKTGRILDDFIFALCDSIKATELRRLNLNFQFCILITDHAFADISRKIEELKSLQHIKLKICEGVKTNNDNKLINSQIRDMGIKSLIEKLDANESLMSMSLEFPWCSGITGTGLSDFPALCEKFINLQTLHIDFYISRQQKSDIKVDYIASGLQNLSALQSLKLTLSENPRNEVNPIDGPMVEQFTNLFNVIGDLISLRYLDFDFFIPDKTGYSVMELLESIKGLQKLQILKLSFHKSEINEEQIQQLLQYLFDLPVLRTLEMNFYRCDYLKASAFDQLIDFIYLKSLKLLFFECKQIKSEVLHNIGKNLEPLKYVEVVDFVSLMKDERVNNMLAIQEEAIKLQHHYKFDTEF